MMNTAISFSLIAALLILSACATQQPRLPGRWKVSGTPNVLMLSKDHSARLMMKGETIKAKWQMVAPDVLIITAPVSPTNSEARTIAYKVPLDGHEGRSLKIFADIDPNTAPIAK